MSEIQHVHLVVAYFDDEDAAKEALEALKEAHKEDDLSIDGAAVVRRDEEGKVHLKEVGDTHAKKGAGVGALIGGAVGVLFGPLGVIGGGAIGAYYGSIVAATVDEGIPNEALEEIATMLPVGGSALVALTSEEDAKIVEEKLASLGGRVVTDGGQHAQVVVPDDIEPPEELKEEDAVGDEADAGETEEAAEEEESSETETEDEAPDA